LQLKTGKNRLTKKQQASGKKSKLFALYTYTIIAKQTKAKPSSTRKKRYFF